MPRGLEDACLRFSAESRLMWGLGMVEVMDTCLRLSPLVSLYVGGPVQVGFIYDEQQRPLLQILPVSMQKQG